MVRVTKLLELVEFKLKERISREPTLLVMVVGVPNVGKSALINSIHQIALSRFPGKMCMCFPLDFIVVQSAIGRQLVSGSDNFRFILVQQKAKRATVGPLPGVTQDIAGFKVNDCFSFFSLGSILTFCLCLF